MLRDRLQSGVEVGSVRPKPAAGGCFAVVGQCGGEEVSEWHCNSAVPYRRNIHFWFYDVMTLIVPKP